MSTAPWRAFTTALRRQRYRREDPETLLAEAEQEIAREQARVRARVARAITDRNNLQQRAADIEKRIRSLEARAEAAHGRGDAAQERRLNEERERYRDALRSAEASVTAAALLLTSMQAALDRLDESARGITEEIQALRAEWQSLRVLRTMSGEAHSQRDERARNVLLAVLAGVVAARVLRRRPRRRVWAV